MNRYYYRRRKVRKNKLLKPILITLLFTIILTLCFSLYKNSSNGFPIIGAEICYFNFELDSDVQLNSNENSISSFQLSDESIVKIDASKVSDSPLKKPLDNSKPEVLIYHTHTTEAFAEAGKFDSTDESNNVVAVGDTIAKELEEKYGIAVIHDKTNHSTSYNSSYSRSNETLNYYLKKYGDFKIILDLHRDGLGAKATKASSTVNINGVNTAQIFFVNSKGSSNYAKQRELTDFLSSKCNELYPGLLKKETIFQRGGLCKQNLNASANSLLMECGSQYNSIAEAKEGGKIIARLFAEKINGTQ